MQHLHIVGGRGEVAKSSKEVNGQVKAGGPREMAHIGLHKFDIQLFFLRPFKCLLQVVSGAIDAGDPAAAPRQFQGMAAWPAAEIENGRARRQID